MLQHISCNVSCTSGQFQGHIGFAPKPQFFASFLRFSFLLWHSSCFSGWRKCAQGANLCKLMGCSKKPSNTTGLKEGTQGNPNRAQGFIATFIDFFKLIATCTKSDRCGTMMMLLHGYRNSGGVISGTYTQMG
jgi:hypothetical protein